MLELAPGVRRLRGFPPAAINAYLVEDVLVDARTRGGRRGILRQLQGERLRAHVVTHGHPDHFGSSHAVCEAFGIPLWAGEGDVHAIETASPRAAARAARGGDAARADAGRAPGGARAGGGRRRGRFVVLETPGHTPGHIALWRESAAC